MHFHIYLVMMARNPVAESALCHITVPTIQQATDRRMGRDAVTNIKTIITTMRQKTELKLTKIITKSRQKVNSNAIIDNKNNS